jgi:hypothetical protein
MNSTYTLDGNENDLKKHVGHRVEVTGTIDSTSVGNRPSTTAGTSTTATTTGTTSTDTTARSTGGTMSGRDMNAPRVRVSSIRMISAECPAR